MCDLCFEFACERAKKQRQVLIDAVKKDAAERVLKRQADGVLNDKEEIQKAIIEEELALWRHLESVWH